MLSWFPLFVHLCELQHFFRCLWHFAHVAYTLANKKKHVAYLKLMAPHLMCEGVSNPGEILSVLRRHARQWLKSRVLGKSIQRSMHIILFLVIISVIKYKYNLVLNYYYYYQITLVRYCRY